MHNLQHQQSVLFANWQKRDKNIIKKLLYIAVMHYSKHRDGQNVVEIVQQWSSPKTSICPSSGQAHIHTRQSNKYLMALTGSHMRPFNIYYYSSSPSQALQSSAPGTWLPVSRHWVKGRTCTQTGAITFAIPTISVTIFFFFHFGGWSSDRHELNNTSPNHGPSLTLSPRVHWRWMEGWNLWWYPWCC